MMPHFSATYPRAAAEAMAAVGAVNATRAHTRTMAANILILTFLCILLR